MGILCYFKEAQSMGTTKMSNTNYIYSVGRRRRLSHLFFNSIYSTQNPLLITNILDTSVWSIANSPKPFASQSNVKIEEMFESIQRFSTNSSFWGLHWTAIGIWKCCPAYMVWTKQKTQATVAFRPPKNLKFSQGHFERC